MSDQEQEYDFLFEHVLAFLHSPLWQVPIHSFVDEYCAVFDGEEENSHSQLTVHKVCLVVFRCGCSLPG